MAESGRRYPTTRLKLVSRRSVAKLGDESAGVAYVGLEDVLGDGRLVDSRVLVGFQMDEGVIRDAFRNGLFWRRASPVSKEAVTSPQEACAGMQRENIAG